MSFTGETEIYCLWKELFCVRKHPLLILKLKNKKLPIRTSQFPFVHDCVIFVHWACEMRKMKYLYVPLHLL